MRHLASILLIPFAISVIAVSLCPLECAHILGLQERVGTGQSDAMKPCHEEAQHRPRSDEDTCSMCSEGIDTALRKNLSLSEAIPTGNLTVSQAVSHTFILRPAPVVGEFLSLHSHSLILRI